MNNNRYTIKFLGRALLFTTLAFSTFGASATLGDGKMAKERPAVAMLRGAKLGSKTSLVSLQSGYTFRGNNVISIRENRFFNTNTVVTIQQGHTSYTLPLQQKKATFNGKLTFNPNHASR